MTFRSSPPRCQRASEPPARPFGAGPVTRLEAVNDRTGHYWPENTGRLSTAIKQRASHGRSCAKKIPGSRRQWASNRQAIAAREACRGRQAWRQIGQSDGSRKPGGIRGSNPGKLNRTRSAEPIRAGSPCRAASKGRTPDRNRQRHTPETPCMLGPFALDQLSRFPADGQNVIIASLLPSAARTA